MYKINLESVRDFQHKMMQIDRKCMNCLYSNLVNTFKALNLKFNISDHYVSLCQNNTKHISRQTQ